MPAKDIFHDCVKIALIKDGWTVTHDPLSQAWERGENTYLTSLALQYLLSYSTDQYLIISEGWDKNQHLHSCLIHVEIIGEKVWIQCDNTEDGIALPYLW